MLQSCLTEFLHPGTLQKNNTDVDKPGLQNTHLLENNRILSGGSSGDDVPEDRKAS